MKIPIVGMAVVYGGADLSDEYMDASTDFGPIDDNTFITVYDHGYNTLIAKQTIGLGRLSREPDGLRLTATLDVPDKFGARLKRSISRGKMGLSTGVLGHLMEREQQRDGRTYLKRWHIGEISLTKKPAEPRTRGVGLKKSLEEIREQAAQFIRAKRENERRIEELKSLGYWDKTVEEIAEQIKRNNKMKELKRENDARIERLKREGLWR